MNLGIVLGATLALNLCCGYFRAQAPKFSWPWFIYIHLPVPVVVLMRLAGGFNYTLIPALLIASVLGQWGGGKLPGAKPKAS